MQILGLAISGLVAFSFLLIGLIGLFAKGSIGQSVRGMLGHYSKLILIALVIIGLMAGGFAYGSGAVKGLFGSVATASAINEGSSSSSDVQLEDCYWASYGGSTQALIENSTFRIDANDRSLLYADVQNESVVGLKTAHLSNAINGTIVCSRTGDIDKAGQTTCTAKAQTYKSLTSTTDSNTYSIVALNVQNSVIPGYSYQQSIYLNDGSIATTSSNPERTTWVFTGGASAQAQDTLGVYATLPGATTFNYLTQQTSKDIVFECGGQKVGTIRVTSV